MLNETLGVELTKLLEPQLRFDALRAQCALGSGRRLCDFSYANPYDGPRKEAIDALRCALDGERQLDLQYTPFGGSTITRRLVAQNLSRSHGIRFHWRDVLMTPGAMAALNIFFRSLKRQGECDEVVMLTPCWQDYPLYLVQHGLVPVHVPLSPPDYRLAPDAVASALTTNTRAVLFSQPANPTGVAYSAEEFEALGQVLDTFAEREGVRPWIVSDECHRDWLLPEVPFASPLSAYERTCVIYSFGKAHLLQGQRTGYLAISPRSDDHIETARMLEAVTRMLGFCTPTALMQIAVRELLGLTPDLSPVVARRHAALDALGAMGYEITPSGGTFFLYGRCPGDDDFVFANRLAEKSVLVLPSSIFHEPGRFRLSLTGSEKMLERALPAFREVHDRLAGGSA